MKEISKLAEASFLKDKKEAGDKLFLQMKKYDDDIKNQYKKLADGVMSDTKRRRKMGKANLLDTSGISGPYEEGEASMLKK